MPVFPTSGLQAALLPTMLSVVLSRSVCQVVAGVTLSARLQGFASRAPSASNPAGNGHDSGNASVVSYPQLKTMLANQHVQLFDVRNPDEFQAGRIAHAVNIPLGVLEERLKLPPHLFQREFHTTSPGKHDDDIVFYCRSGNRSARALAVAHQLGFHRARHYKGGYSEWAELEAERDQAGF